jgi:transposase InsO family protein
MSEEPKATLRNWAHLRFSIIGPLLASPPERGDLKAELEALAARRYAHPTRPGELVRFALSTIERWYYQAQASSDPIAALSRRVRIDAGERKAIDSRLFNVLREQYNSFPSWSVKLHTDNLVEYLREHPELGDAPSYSSVRRLMAQRGWIKKASPRTPGQRRAAERLEFREVRSFESQYVHGLWHLDFHHCSRRVLDAKGVWHTPKALCVLDDRSRLCCHIQWYLAESAENLIHALTQAFQKRGLPRALMSDNGPAMLAAETENGLLRLGVVHETTLPYSPYQNGKQESFWGQLEGRLIAMLKNIDPLSLEFLNRASQAWAELEYNRSVHSEIAMSPLDRLVGDKAVSRPCPDTRELRLAFCAEESRSQRRGDGTVTIKGVRFEVPARMRHLQRLQVFYRTWDLSVAYLVGPKDGRLITEIYPQDKTQNSSGVRRTITPDTSLPSVPRQMAPMPPLLRRLLADYAATGLPPAYIPKEEKDKSDDI